MVFEWLPYTNFHDINLDRLIRDMKDLKSIVKELSEQIPEMKDKLEELEDFYSRLLEGDFPKSFIEALGEWCRENVPEILKYAIKSVYFGLTKTGYFVAYIPDSWRDIVFNTTGLDINVDICPEYGHLVLSMEVGGAEETWQ